jgi:hypothetical protein
MAAGKFVMTLHAEEEMENDGLTIEDVAATIASGMVVARQRDLITGGWKYRIAGTTRGGASAEVVAKLGATAKVVVITVYLLDNTHDL